MRKLSHFVGEASRCILDKSHEMLGFGHLWAQDLHSLLIDLHAIGLLVCLNLRGNMYTL